MNKNMTKYMLSWEVTLLIECPATPVHYRCRGLDQCAPSPLRAPARAQVGTQQRAGGPSPCPRGALQSSRGGDGQTKPPCCQLGGDSSE